MSGFSIVLVLLALPASAWAQAAPACAAVAKTDGPTEADVRAAGLLRTGASPDAIAAARAWLATTATPCVDWRPTVELRGFSGLSIDTFAADDLARYLNPDDATGEQARLSAGLTFAYRLSAARGLWLVGSTRYGVRSADVNCAEDAALGVCQPFSARRDAWLYVLRHARSLEASGGLRWEFWSLNASSEAPAALYIKAVAGLMTVAGGGSDALDQHALTLGLIVTGGAYQDSYVDVGWGRSDVYAVTPTPRLRVEGYFSLGRYRMVRPFFQVTLDADLQRGADSIQTHVGAAFDLDRGR